MRLGITKIIPLGAAVAALTLVGAASLALALVDIRAGLGRRP